MKYAVLALFLALPSASTATAQITSAAAGGPWGEQTTWVGNAIPTADDDVIIVGPVQADYSGEARNLTVNATGSIVATLSKASLYVHGDIVNYGRIEDGIAKPLWITVWGDVRNENIWTSEYLGALELLSAYPHTLSHCAECSLPGIAPIHNWNTGGPEPLTAASNLVLGYRVELGYGVLKMGPYDLTLRGPRLSNGEVYTAGAFTADESCEFWGLTVHGDVALYGVLNVSVNNVFTGNVTVYGTLQASPLSGAARHGLTVEGDLTNFGTIQNGPGGETLTLSTYGDLRNEGSWENETTRLLGHDSITLSQLPGLSWNSVILAAPQLAEIEALSDLSFGKLVDLSRENPTGSAGAVLDLGGHNLDIWGTLRHATLTNAATIRGHGTDDFYRVSVLGDVTLEDITNKLELWVSGDLTLTGTLEQGNVYAYGDIVNKGHLAPRKLWSYGSIGGEGTYGAMGIKLMGDHARTLWMPRHQIGNSLGVTALGSNVQLEGENALPGLYVYPDAYAVLAEGATLEATQFLPSGLVNRGSIRVQRLMDALSTTDVWGARLQLSTGQSDSVSVATHGFSTPSSYGNAVAHWFTVESQSGVATGTMRLWYGDDHLGDNDESNLQIWRASIPAGPWEQLSTDANTSRNAEENWVEIRDVQLGGDFVLSSLVAVNVVPDVDDALPDAFTLSPWHPNPFKESASLDVGLEEAGTLRVEVFDLLGRTVAVLYDGQLPAGLHRVGWMPAHAPSGTYIAVISTGGLSHTSTLVRIR